MHCYRNVIRPPIVAVESSITLLSTLESKAVPGATLGEGLGNGTERNFADASCTTGLLHPHLVYYSIGKHQFRNPYLTSVLVFGKNVHHLVQVASDNRHFPRAILKSAFLSSSTPSHVQTESRCSSLWPSCSASIIPIPIPGPYQTYPHYG